jgi:hypothetical protein
LTVTCEHLPHQGDSRVSHHIREQNHATVWQAFNEDECTKVGINRHQHASFPCSFEQRSIAWAWPALAGLDHIVSFAAQPVCQAATGATTHEGFHPFATEIASS